MQLGAGRSARAYKTGEDICFLPNPLDSVFNATTCVLWEDWWWFLPVSLLLASLGLI